MWDPHRFTRFSRKCVSGHRARAPRPQDPKTRQSIPKSQDPLTPRPQDPQTRASGACGRGGSQLHIFQPLWMNPSHDPLIFQTLRSEINSMRSNPHRSARQRDTFTHSMRPHTGPRECPSMRTPIGLHVKSQPASKQQPPKPSNAVKPPSVHQVLNNLMPLLFLYHHHCA